MVEWVILFHEGTGFEGEVFGKLLEIVHRFSYCIARIGLTQSYSAEARVFLEGIYGVYVGLA